MQVGLPGGKKESQDSNVGIIIGAAAGGVLFALVLLLTFCCCCCLRRGKSATGGATSSSSTSSQSGNTGLDMPGSLVGFTDSNQKLLPPSPEQRSYSKAFPPSILEMKTSKSSQIYGDDYQGKTFFMCLIFKLRKSELFSGKP